MQLLSSLMTPDAAPQGHLAVAASRHESNLQRSVRGKVTLWAQIGAPPVVLRWIRFGVRIPFISVPSPLCVPARPLQPELQSWVQHEIHRCRQTGAWSLVRTQRAQLYQAPAHLVPKRSGGARVVVDLRYINAFTVPHPCRYESLSILHTMLHRGDWICSLDLKDAYHSFGICQQHQQFFGFALGNARLQAAALPFGWNLSPFVFTKAMRVVVKFWRAQGRRLLPYLDDFLLIAPSREQLERESQEFLRLLQALGLRVNIDKCHLQPSQCLEHLGLLVDTQQGTFSVPQRRLEDIQSLAVVLLRHATLHRRFVSARLLARLSGLVQSLHLAMADCGLHLRSLYDCIGRLRHWDRDVRLSSRAMTDLRWLAAILTRPSPSEPIWRPATNLVLATDASDLGWGATLSRPHGEPLTAHGTWTQEQRELPIFARETVAILFALQTFVGFLARNRVRILTDNTVALAALTRWTSPSPLVMSLARRIHHFCSDMAIKLVETSYVPSALNTADAPSRIMDQDNWSLTPRWVSWAFRRWGVPQVDRFADNNNRVVLRFNSRWWCPQVEALDGLAQVWSGCLNWVNPPWPLLPQVVEKLKQEPAAAAIVVAPLWVAQPWWVELLKLAAEVVVLPQEHGLFSPGQSINPSIRVFRSPAWRVVLAFVPSRQVQVPSASLT